jgi:hypothetical protein
MPNPFNRESSTHSRSGAIAPLVLLIALVLFSVPATAQVYPVNGVFSAIDARYPSDRAEGCMALKTFGVDAVTQEAVAELIIFTKDKRYDVKGDVQIEERLRSIKKADGGFRITELPAKSGRLPGFRRKTSYFLRVVDPFTIEIWDGTTLTQYAKCGPQKAPV